MTDQEDLAEPVFRTSSFSETGNCVEVQQAPGNGLVAVRNSRQRDQPPLVFSPEEWRAFIQGVKAGEFDPV